jgi:sugar phosphate isomerase/epimerase
MNAGNFGISMYLMKEYTDKFKGVNNYSQVGDLGDICLNLLRDFTEFADRNGFQVIELTTMPLMSAKVLAEISTDIKKTISRFCKVTYHLPIHEINICALQQGIRREAIEETKRHIDICEKVGIYNVVMHPGTFDAMPKWYAIMGDRVRMIAEKSVLEIYAYCKDRSIQLSLENLHRNEPLFNRPEEFQTFMDKGLGLVLDTVHAFVSTVDPTDFIKRFPNNITEIHLTDGIEADPVTHYAIGQGQVDCLAVLEELKKINFEGPIIIEVESKKDLISSKMYLQEKSYL